MKKNKVALMIFAAAMLSTLMFGAIGDTVDEAYASDMDDDDADDEEYFVEVFDIAFVSVIILSILVLTLYRKKN